MFSPTHGYVNDAMVRQRTKQSKNPLYVLLICNQK